MISCGSFDTFKVASIISSALPLKQSCGKKSKLRYVPSEDDEDGYNSEEEIKSSKVEHLAAFDG